MITLIGLLMLWGSTLLTPSVSVPLANSNIAASPAIAATNDDTTATNTPIANVSESSASLSSPAATTEASCPGGELVLTDRKVTSLLCGVEVKAKRLIAVYTKRNPGTTDPIRNPTLRSLLTTTSSCRGDLYTQLSYYDSLMIGLAKLYTDNRSKSVYPRRVLYLSIAIGDMQQNLREDCQNSTPPIDCSAMTSSSSLPGVVTNQTFGGNVDYAHNWGSTLARLLLQSVQSLSEGQKGFCARRRRKSANGKRRNRRRGGRGGKRRGGAQRRQIQEQLELEIVSDVSQLADSIQDDDDSKNNNISTEVNNNNNNNNNNAMSSSIPEEAKTSVSDSARGKVNGEEERSSDQAQKRRRKNRRRGRKNRGKGRRNKQENRRRRRQGAKKGGAGKNRRSNRAKAGH